MSPLCSSSSSNQMTMLHRFPSVCIYILKQMCKQVKSHHVHVCASAYIAYTGGARTQHCEDSHATLSDTQPTISSVQASSASVSPIRKRNHMRPQMVYPQTQMVTDGSLDLLGTAIDEPHRGPPWSCRVFDLSAAVSQHWGRCLLSVLRPSRRAVRQDQPY